MGANARRRHGPIDTTPKVGTPVAQRAVPETIRQGVMGFGSYQSRRELKRRERRSFDGPIRSAHDRKLVREEA